MQIAGLDHVNIVTRDMAGTLAFYRSVLELGDAPVPPMPPAIRSSMSSNMIRRAIRPRRWSGRPGRSITSRCRRAISGPWWRGAGRWACRTAPANRRGAISGSCS